MAGGAPNGGKLPSFAGYNFYPQNLDDYRDILYRMVLVRCVLFLLGMVSSILSIVILVGINDATGILDTSTVPFRVLAHSRATLVYGMVTAIFVTLFSIIHGKSAYACQESASKISENIVSLFKYTFVVDLFLMCMSLGAFAAGLGSQMVDASFVDLVGSSPDEKDQVQGMTNGNLACLCLIWLLQLYLLPMSLVLFKDLTLVEVSYRIQSQRHLPQA